MRKYPKVGNIEHKADHDGNIPLPAYAGADIVSIFSINGLHFQVRNITTLSIDSNRGIIPIPTLGRIRVNRFTRGHRYIAGTLVLLATTRGPLGFVGPNTVTPNLSTYLFDESSISRYRYDTIAERDGVVLDKIPPFDISISYMDEYGRMSHETLYGVIIYKESKVASINDLVTEIQCGYYALDRSSTVSSDNFGIYNATYGTDIAENIIFQNNIQVLNLTNETLRSQIESSSDSDVISKVPIIKSGFGDIEYAFNVTVAKATEIYNENKKTISKLLSDNSNKL